MESLVPQHPQPPARRFLLLVVIALCSSAGSGAACFTVYWLLGIPLFPPGAVGRVLLLAPLVTPLVVAPIVSLPIHRSTRRGALLLEEVQAARAALAAEVAERTAAQERLEELVRRDPLTGVLNRRGFFEQWSSWGEDELLVVTVDIDSFKEVNDRAGHAAGDLVLQAVAGVLGTSLDGPASVARLGGDEFVLVAAAAQEPAVKRLESRLSALTVERPDGPPLLVSCSFGSARLRHDCPLDRALAEADERMYHTKRGRHGRQARPEPHPAALGSRQEAVVGP